MGTSSLKRHFWDPCLAGTTNVCKYGTSRVQDLRCLLPVQKQEAEGDFSFNCLKPGLTSSIDVSAIQHTRDVAAVLLTGLSANSMTDSEI